MGNFLDKIMKRINVAKGQSNVIVNGRTMTGGRPNQVLINPDIQMKTESFTKFISHIHEENEKGEYSNQFMKSRAGTDDAERHVKNYLNHTVDTVMIGKNHQDIPENTEVELKGTKIIDGVHHAIVDHKGNTHTIPINKLRKPKKSNKGFAYEAKVYKTLEDDNMTPQGASAAGFTGGNDFALVNKRKKTIHEGEAEPDLYQGEAKNSTKAAFGQLTLHHDPEKGGWHIPDEVRKKHPEFAQSIENGRHESGKSLLDHINETVPPPIRGTRSLSGDRNIYSQETDLSPMHAYLKDHHVDILHVGTHGTYRAGLSQEKDRTGTNLPPATGMGRFRVRGKHSSGNLTVQFSPTQLNSSNVNIENPENRMSIKKALGHNIDQITTPPATAPTKWAESVDLTNIHRRHHVLFFGRVNPPHAGHEAAYNLVKKLGKKYNGTSSMILSRTQDNKKNPLSPEQKEEHAKKAFPDVVTQVADKEHPTLLHQLSKLHENGVTDLHMVAGSDRIPEYQKLINNYNGQTGPHGYYNFKSINLHSAGERDPDSEGVTGVSASSQRLHAQNGKYDKFASGAPSTMKPNDVKKLYDDVRSGLAPPKPSREKPCDKCGRVGCKVHKD